MSKEQKTLKSCYILDRLREWFELYGNQNHQRAEEELHLAIDELYEYQQKYQKITDLEAKLAESEEENKKLVKALNGEVFINYKLPMENAKLKQQLAENGKEIEKLNACVDFYKSYYISFKGKVIDELEKVKRYIDDNAYYLEEENFGKEINEYIDTQINGLKGNELV